MPTSSGVVGGAAGLTTAATPTASAAAIAVEAAAVAIEAAVAIAIEAASVAVSIAAAAASATAAASTTAAPALGLVYADASTIELGPIHLFHGLLCVGLLNICHEPKAARAACIAIEDDFGLFNGAELLKGCPKGSLICGPRKATDKEFLGHGVCLVVSAWRMLAVRCEGSSRGVEPRRAHVQMEH